MGFLFLQLFVGGCFVALIIVLFFEKTDYLTYSIFLIVVASLVTAIFIPAAATLDFYVEKIEWELVFFLIAMFTIVEILNEKKVFHEVARRIVTKYSKTPRKMFYVICITSTLAASIIEDLSIALIFGPVIIIVCRRLNLNPAPFLLGMTISINLGATLTPFGSAQNVLIANAFNLDVIWFLEHLGIYFVVSTAATLFFLDKLILRKSLKKVWSGQCALESAVKDYDIDTIEASPMDFKKNLGLLAAFIALLLLIPEIYVAGLIAMVLFVFANPVQDEHKKWRPAVSHYLRRVDYKLIYFFICLFVFIGLMELNGTIALLENLLASMSLADELVLALIILVATSVLSGFLDNTPVVIIFLPVITFLINKPEFYAFPLLMAFIIGINVGGNFLPQGSACDMATLEIARNNCVVDLPFKRLFKVGGIFALIHVLLGAAYITTYVLLFPG
ncbi:MAG: hypothetical protein JW839_10275 [Candidatus Lokiarchaeota archaeon]|nr:hypothetical protein [Candidatus Lokiarchaeota archaeon]